MLFSRQSALDFLLMAMESLNVHLHVFEDADYNLSDGLILNEENNCGLHQ